MNPQIFREYDVRGVVDKDLTDDVAEKLGRGLGTLCARAHGRTLVVVAERGPVAKPAIFSSDRTGSLTRAAMAG